MGTFATTQTSLTLPSPPSLLSALDGDDGGTRAGGPGGFGEAAPHRALPLAAARGQQHLSLPEAGWAVDGAEGCSVL